MDSELCLPSPIEIDPTDSYTNRSWHKSILAKDVHTTSPCTTASCKATKNKRIKKSDTNSVTASFPGSTDEEELDVRFYMHRPASSNDAESGDGRQQEYFECKYEDITS